MDTLVGVGKAAKALGLSRARIKVLADEGRIGKKYADRWLFSRGELAEFAKLDRPSGRPKLAKSA